MNVNDATNTNTDTSTGDAELDALNQQIDAKQQQVDELRRQAAIYEQQLQTKKSEAATLSGEVSDLNDSIESSQNQLETNQAQLESLQLQIQKVERQIADKEEDISSYRESLASLLRQLYATDQVSNLELLVEEQTFSAFFSRVQSLSTISGSVDKALDRVVALKQQLDESKSDLDVKRTQLDDAREQLEQSQELLTQQQSYKASLLMQTQESESQYQELMKKVTAEASSLDAEIEALVRQVNSGDSTVVTDLSWPVDPSRGITAYFNDADYQTTFGIPHKAIDIRAYQGTAVLAAADGVVQRAEHPDWLYASKLSSGKCPSGYLDYGSDTKCRRSAYNYVIISHDGGLATMYLHLSQVNVAVGQTVKRGDVIGRSGGTPNTAGAGSLTTGPHLHFAVYRDGIPVDPLKYLPSL